jgi:diguanylate cyclase
MRYKHDVKEAAEFLRLALHKLGEHKLPANPTNYAVWYEHVSNLNPSISNIINENLKQAIYVSNDLSQHLYSQYILDRGKNSVNELKGDLTNIIEEVFADISSAESDYSNFGVHLNNFAKNLSKGTDKASFKNSFQNLVQEVKSVGKTNKAFSEKLKSTNSELKTLQIKLKEVEQFASTDALTGLYNRRSFEEQLAKHIDECADGEGDLSLIMADIDHFKRVNDTHGHLIGDDLLRIVSKTMRDQVKRKDIVCRYGGEEFVIVLPETRLEGAVAVAENIRKHFADMTWKQKSSGTSLGKITLSFGVSNYIHGEKGNTFLNRADKALYQSKNNGRNRVSVASN